MLKSTLNSPERNNSKRPTLPHLFKHTDSPMVILFTDENTGIAVVGGACDFGAIKGFWASCWDTNHWTPLLPGESVTIMVESED